MFRFVMPVLATCLLPSFLWANDQYRSWDIEASQYYEEPTLNSVYEDSLYKYQKQNVLFMNNPDYVLTAFVGRCLPTTFKPFMLPFYKSLYSGIQDEDLTAQTCQNIENQQGATVINVNSTTTQFTDVILDIVFPTAYSFEYRDWGTAGGPTKQHIDDSASFMILVKLSTPGFCLPTVGAVTDGGGTSEITIEYRAPEQVSTETLELNCTSPITSFHYNGFGRLGPIADAGHLDGALVKKVTLQGPNIGGGVALPPAPVPNPNAPIEGPKNCPIEKPSSIIRVDNLSFGEEIAIVGTGAKLVYSSEFASSYQVAFQNLNRQKSFNPEAWTLSIHHYYDKNQDRLFLGSGRSFVKASSVLPGNQEMVVMDGEVFIFDGDGKHLATKSSLTGYVKYQFSYNTAGYLTSITDAFGNITQLTRNTSNQLVSITSPWGQVTTITLGAAFNITEIRNPNNEATSIEYYEGTDLLRRFTTPMGRITEVVYDGLGRIAYTKKVKGSYQFGKMKVGNKFVVSQVTQMGRKTDMESEINPLSGSYVRKVVHPDGVEEVYTENANGSGMFSSPRGVSFSNLVNDERFGALDQRMSKYTSVRKSGMREISISKSYVGLTSDPFNYTSMETREQIGTSVWKNNFLKVNNSVSSETPEGVKTYILLDSNERPTSVQLNQDYPTLFEYYPNGNLKKIIQNGHDLVEYTYNSQGFLSKVKNNRNEEVQYAYDLAGRVLTQTIGGSTTTFTYNGDGDVLSVVPSGKPSHIFTVDYAGDITSYKPPVLSAVSQTATRYTYNEDRQLTQLMAPQRPPLRFNYDEVSGLLTQVYVSRDEQQRLYYDNGRVSRIRSFDGVETSYSYDGDLLTVIETKTPDSPNSYERLSYAYNGNYLPKRRDLAADWMRGTSSTVISYDNDYSVTKVGDLDISYQHGTGRVQGTQIGRIYDQYSYDGYGRLSSYQAQYKVNPSDPNPVDLYSYQLSYDALGRIIGKAEVIQAKTTVFTYAYDNLGRLVGVQKNGANYASYQYDSNGNRTVSQVARLVENATYDDQDRLLTFGNRTFQYYDSGDLKSKQRGVELPQEFTYNSFGSLKSIRLSQGSTISYKLDAAGSRVGSYRNGKIEARTLYQDYARIAADFDEKGRTSREYIHALGPNAPDYMIFKAQKYRYIKDHLGSPRLLVRVTDGQVVQRLDYDVWGRIELDTNRGFQPYGFAGGIYDLNTGTLKFGVRIYDPEVGRWISKDPILFDGGDANIYVYVSNDPVNNIDPAGTSWINVVSGVLTGAVTAYQNYNDASSLKGAKTSQIIASTSLGFISGFLGGFVGSYGMGRSTVAVAFASGLNNAGNQFIFKGSVSSSNSLGWSMVVGAGSGFVGGAMGKVLPGITPLNEEGAKVFGLPLSILGLNSDNGIPECLPED